MQIKKVKIFEREDVENLERIIEKNYGAKINLREFFVFQGKDEKIWIGSKDVLKIKADKLLVNSIGLNFGKMKRNEKIHLTIEGSQIVGKDATRNTVLLDDFEAKRFLQGADVKPIKEINCDYHNFVIVRFKNDILGSALLTEEGLKNFLPKSRRMLI